MTKPKPGAHYHRWTADEDGLVLAQRGLDGDLARQLGVTVTALRTRRCLLRKAAGPDATPGRMSDPRVSHVGTVKVCPVCGARFKARPSGWATCSDKCARYRSGTPSRGKGVVWSEEAKRRRKDRGYTENLKRGPAAAAVSPLTGSFETNVRAKKWWVIHLESGQRWPAVRNLAKWCRDHADLFAPDDWRRAHGGLLRVQRWLMARTERKISRWKAFSLYREARQPNE